MIGIGNMVLGFSLSNILINMIINTRVSCFFVQDRRDLVGTHGSLDQLATTGSSSFSNATHRLRHTPTTDFQPPYFPPPYSVPQQPGVDFHHHVNPDPYAHLNHYNTGHHQQYVNPHDRQQILGSSADPLANSIHRGFPSAYDTRRTDYGSVNRPEVLIPPRGPHDLHDSSGLLSLPGGGLSVLDDQNQVSLCFHAM